MAYIDEVERCADPAMQSPCSGRQIKCDWKYFGTETLHCNRAAFLIFLCAWNCDVLLILVRSAYSDELLILTASINDKISIFAWEELSSSSSIDVCLSGSISNCNLHLAQLLVRLAWNFDLRNNIWNLIELVELIWLRCARTRKRSRDDCQRI